MYDKLDLTLEKFDELTLKASDPDIMGDRALWQ